MTDMEAWEILGENFTDDRGIIRRIDESIYPTDEQWRAIDTLCNEYDYQWQAHR